MERLNNGNESQTDFYLIISFLNDNYHRTEIVRLHVVAELKIIIALSVKINLNIYAPKRNFTHLLNLLDSVKLSPMTLVIWKILCERPF